jgi:hypothetical protein
MERQKMTRKIYTLGIILALLGLFASTVSALSGPFSWNTDYRQAAYGVYSNLSYAHLDATLTLSNEAWAMRAGTGAAKNRTTWTGSLAFASEICNDSRTNNSNLLSSGLNVYAQVFIDSGGQEKALECYNLVGVSNVGAGTNRTYMTNVFDQSYYNGATLQCWGNATWLAALPNNTKVYLNVALTNTLGANSSMFSIFDGGIDVVNTVMPVDGAIGNNAPAVIESNYMPTSASTDYGCAPVITPTTTTSTTLPANVCLGGGSTVNARIRMNGVLPDNSRVNLSNADVWMRRANLLYQSRIQGFGISPDLQTDAWGYFNMCIPSSFSDSYGFAVNKLPLTRFMEDAATGIGESTSMGWTITTLTSVDGQMEWFVPVQYDSSTAINASNGTTTTIIPHNVTISFYLNPGSSGASASNVVYKAYGCGESKDGKSKSQIESSDSGCESLTAGWASIGAFNYSFNKANVLQYPYIVATMDYGEDANVPATYLAKSQTFRWAVSSLQFNFNMPIGGATGGVQSYCVKPVYADGATVPAVTFTVSSGGASPAYSPASPGTGPFCWNSSSSVFDMSFSSATTNSPYVLNNFKLNAGQTYPIMLYRPANASVANTTYCVNKTVLNTDGTPYANKLVTITVFDLYNTPIATYSASTNAAGVYSICGIPEGTRWLATYQDAYEGGGEGSDGYHEPGTGDVGGGSTVDPDTTGRMAQQFYVYYISAQGSRDVQGASVTVVSNGAPAGSCTTGSPTNGRCTIQGLIEGATYSYTVRKSGFVDSRGSILVHGAAESVLMFERNPVLCTLMGYVRFMNATASMSVSGMTVDVSYLDSGGIFGTAMTDSTGKYELSVACNQGYKASVRYNGLTFSGSAPVGGEGGDSSVGRADIIIDGTAGTVAGAGATLMEFLASLVGIMQLIMLFFLLMMLMLIVRKMGGG